MKTYSRTELESKKLSELKEIAEGLRLTLPSDCDKRIKANWVAEILAAQPQKVSDDVAASPSEYTIEPVGKTNTQIAYVVRKSGQRIGLIFQLYDNWQCGDGKYYANSEDAIAGLERLTSNPSEGIEVLRVSEGKYTSLDGEAEIIQSGEIAVSARQVLKLWKKPGNRFYYRTLQDAIKEVDPVAVQARYILPGDEIFIVDAKKRVKTLARSHKQGIQCLAIICEDGSELKRFFYELVQIAQAMKAVAAC
ncbi:hypothetical protein NIES4101_53280 [Calothrix sp. NIES-4101]|nr:hypothetical protein NIES4101_53280 [Calothrix sp. NIES-4101]